MNKMRALGIRQPHAEQIMRGRKKIEYRNEASTAVVVLSLLRRLRRPAELRDAGGTRLVDSRVLQSRSCHVHCRCRRLVSTICLSRSRSTTSSRSGTASPPAWTRCPFRNGSEPFWKSDSRHTVGRQMKPGRGKRSSNAYSNGFTPADRWPSWRFGQKPNSTHSRRRCGTRASAKGWGKSSSISVGVFFMLENEHATVGAIMRPHRNPKSWQERE